MKIEDGKLSSGKETVEEYGNVLVLTPTEIRKLLDAPEGMEYQTLFMLAIANGERQGELPGLKWSDVDWEASQISIQRTSNTGQRYKPKSKKSLGRIDLGQMMMVERRKWRLACPPSELGLVFPSTTGTPIDSLNMIHRVFHPALKKAGLPRVRFATPPQAF